MNEDESTTPQQPDEQAQAAPTIRAKFGVTEVTMLSGDPSGRRRYKLNAIYDHSTPENQRFTRATPWGELTMVVDNPEVRMPYGQVFYLDFTPADQ